MRLVLGHDALVAQWAKDKYAAGLPPYIQAMGIVDDEGNIRGAATLHEFNGFNVELCYWGPGTASIHIARQITAICFDGLKVLRITCRTPRGNKVLVKHLPRIGFRYEGLLRRYYGPTRAHDAILFGALRSDALRLLRAS